MTAELIDFLRACLAEDEQTAKTLLNDTRPGRALQWEFCEDGAIRDADSRDAVLRVKFTWPQEAAHILRHQPVRVLAEIDAKRRLIELHEPVILRGGGGAEYFNTTRVCRSCEPPKQFPETAYPCPTLRLLALPYAGRPDYKEGWRP